MPAPPISIACLNMFGYGRREQFIIPSPLLYGFTKSCFPMYRYRFIALNGLFYTVFALFIQKNLHNRPARPEVDPTSVMPPVAICTSSMEITLNSSGFRNLNAAQLDEGSYDPNGNFVFFKIRRVVPGPCGSDSLFRSQLRFCCADAGDTLQVVLRAYNIAVDTGGISPLFGQGNYADCIAQVIVRETIKPTIAILPDVTISCEEHLAIAQNVPKPDVTDNCCLDTVTHIDQNFTYDPACKRGVIRRRFTARDCAGNTATSTQLVTVTSQQHYFVQMPDDRSLVGCADLSPTALGMPFVVEGACENVSINHIDTILYNAQSGTCMFIKRTWRVFNWCEYIAGVPFNIVPNPTPEVNLLAPANLVGPLVGSNDVATEVKIKPSDPTATNFSAFWTANANGYFYQQYIYVYDTVAPLGTHRTPPATCDNGINDPSLWQGLGWYNPADSTDNQPEAYVNIELVVSDQCSGGDVLANYILYLDLNADGVQETFINSASPPPAGSILTNNVSTQGLQRLYDRRNIAIDLKYIFALQKSTANDSTHLRVRWNTMAQPNGYTLPQLPYGYHRIIWTVADRCGNTQEYQQEFTISDDCVAPTVGCASNVTVSIPSTGSDSVMVQLSEVFVAALDNMTPSMQIEKAIERTPFGMAFPLDDNGFPQQSVLFDCSDIGFRPVRVWARDAFGNAAHCASIVTVIDPDEACPSYQPAVSGTAHNLKNELVPLEFELYRMPDTLLVGNASNMPLNFYYFNDLEPFGNYFVRPRLDTSDILNGANAFDLILISRHILNLEPFDAPYKLIAADINRSGTITTFDIVTLRKVILGTLTEFPENTSWRFVPQDFFFPMPNNPFATPFPEQINLSSVFNTINDANFRAIKIGDVDYSASPIPAMGVPEDRTDWPIGLEVEVAAHEARNGRTPIYITATEPLAGAQFVLEMPGAAQFVPVLADEEHFHWANGALSVVLDKFEPRIGQKQHLGWLVGQSNNMRLGDTRTLRTTAYGPNGEQRGIILTNVPHHHRPPWLTLQPNPASNRATVAFVLESDTKVVLEVRDCNQRQVASVVLDRKAGQHRYELDTANWPSGVYSVSMRSSERVETAKLIKI